MTRVLVVDDSRLVRTVVGDALESAGYDVETAIDGESAVEAVARAEPDVVTMDVEMPGMGGIEAIDRIMSTNPTAVLMLSAHTQAGAEATLEALDRGAIDVLEKPDGTGAETLGHMVDSVVERIDELANADVSTLALAQTTAAANRVRAGRHKRAIPVGANSIEAPEEGPRALERPTVDHPTIVVGASTGGPKIVERLFRLLPPSLDAKVVVVQHMPAGFTSRFADRLDAKSEYRVREAGDGERIQPGEAVVAPGGYHLEIVANDDGELVVEHDDGPRIHGVRPSIDVTMETAADVVTDPLAGVVLTGMGRDGARGIEAIESVGGRTIAQDEETSPVFGIPKQAIETGAVDEVVPADGLVESIVEAFTEGECHG